MKRALVVFLGGVGILAACSDSISRPTFSEALAPTQRPSAYVVSASVTGATVSTDKEDYAPGEVVVISGKGWAPREAVHLSLVEQPFADGPHDWHVVADATGAFTDTSFTPGLQHLGVTFTLTATGATSGTSVAMFTDGNFQIHGRDGSQHQLIGNAEDVGPVEQGTSINLSCSAQSGLSLKRGGSYSGSVTWTIAPVTISSSPSGTTALSSGVTLSPNTGALAAANESDCVTMAVTTTGLTIGTTYIGGVSATAIGDTPGPYYFKFTVTQPTPGDATPPTISPTITGTLGDNGWYTSNVKLTWTVTDNESSVTGTSGCAEVNVTADQQETTYTCTATSAGGSASQSVKIKRDATAPTALASTSPAPNASGWNNTNVTVSFSGSDVGSGLLECDDAMILSTEGANQSGSGVCKDNAGNTATATQSGINIDKTAPTVTATPSPGPNGNGWNNTSVTIDFEGTDLVSGVASCDADVVLGSEGVGQTATGSCSDNAGNTASATASGINIDLTNPTVSLLGGPASGSSHYFGSVPAAPTCSASDSPSGLDGACAVVGYGTAVGPHTVTASAKDLAGNTSSTSATYSVLAWTLRGFYQPVDMNGVHNIVKGGSTVPLKFEVFAGTTELSATASVKSFSQIKISCGDGSAQEDEIEVTTTGGTSLRYDAIGGQFIQNWQTPRTPGACYKVVMTTQDDSYLTAFFKLK
jgi:hypothetical protein